MPENFDFHGKSEELLREAMKAFAEWMGKNWTVTPAEAETLTEETSSPTEYARGFNAGVGAVEAALEVWLEDGQPYGR